MKTKYFLSTLVVIIFVFASVVYAYAQPEPSQDNPFITKSIDELCSVKYLFSEDIERTFDKVNAFYTSIYRNEENDAVEKLVKFYEGDIIPPETVCFDGVEINGVEYSSGEYTLYDFGTAREIVKGTDGRYYPQDITIARYAQS